MSSNITEPNIQNSKDTEISKEDNAGFFFKIKNFVLKICKIKEKASIEEELAELFDERDPDKLEVTSEERTILQNVISFGDLRVIDIMIPRTDIATICETVKLPDLKQVIIEKEHTRFPVYKDSLDNITGFLHIKDLVSLLGTNKSLNLKKIIREILFVPPSMKIMDLLLKMQEKRVHIAIVLDEYGGTEGLVTMEDIMEEIVGEIKDEHDDLEEIKINKIDKDNFEASSRASIKEIEELIDINLTIDEKNEEDYDTIGGLIFYMLSRVPKKGEIIKHPSGLEFKIIEADPRRIKKVLIRKI